jgi:murein L,D-transpeptidase YafK
MIYENEHDSLSIATVFGGGVAAQLELLKPAIYHTIHEGNEVTLVRSPNGNYIAELSTGLLTRYKDKASDDASKADKEMNFKRGDKRFSGIVKATKKQFDNDSKKVTEAAANKTSAHVAATADNKELIAKDSKNGLVKPKNDKTLLTLATVRAIKGK